MTKGFFQLTFLIIFIVGAIFGILVFSGTIKLGSDGSKATGTVVVWGTIKAAAMAAPLEDFNNTHPDFVVRYVEKSAQSFDQDLLEALASGTGPDMFFLPDNLAYHYSNKIFPIPYTSYALNTFNSTFSGAGNVFLTSNGILAFPMMVDPLVMYYNRSLLDAGAVVYPPKVWDDLLALAPTLTKKDDSQKITQSAVALGHYTNVTNAKDILVALFMQLGNPILAEEGGVLHSALDSTNSKYDLSTVLSFYTDFANPAKSVYSWNKSFPNSSDAFSAEELAIYFGFASELQSLVNKNPNQNFFAAPLPQVKGATTKLTSARVTGLAISSATKNLNTAFTAASLMATTEFAGKLATALSVAPARLDLLAAKPAKDAYAPIFYDSALYARSWMDPSPSATNAIFRNMVDQVLSNSLTPRDAITDASAKLDLLLVK